MFYKYYISIEFFFTHTHLWSLSRPRTAATTLFLLAASQLARHPLLLSPSRLHGPPVVGVAVTN